MTLSEFDVCEFPEARVTDAEDDVVVCPVDKSTRPELDMDDFPEYTVISPDDDGDDEDLTIASFDTPLATETAPLVAYDSPTT